MNLDNGFFSYANVDSEIARLLTSIAKCESSQAITLVGGNALALQIGHRRSFDLDFRSFSHKLDRKAVEDIIQSLKKDGFAGECVTDFITRIEWDDAGLDVDDYQQDWAINGIKVSFFAIDEETERTLQTLQEQNLRILSAAEVFYSKLETFQKRTVARDFLDIYVFLREDSRCIEAGIHRVKESDASFTYEKFKMRMLSLADWISDEKFLQSVDGLADELPKTAAELVSGIEKAFRDYEKSLAQTISANVNAFSVIEDPHEYDAILQEATRAAQKRYSRRH